MSIMESNSISVSVCMITFNHGRYIEQAIEGVLAQHTNFCFELIISDDHSSDNTREICQRYYDQYPDRIRLLYRDQNLGIFNNFFQSISYATGEYIAICEGDDFWIDPYKLQKQKDFLDNKPNASLVYHNAIVEDGDKRRLFLDLNAEEHIITTEELLKKWAIPTASIMFRKESLFFPSPVKQFQNADYFLEILLQTKGDIHYIPYIMSVYRKHSDSASELMNKDIVSLYNGLVDLLTYCKPMFSNNEQFIFDSAISFYRQQAKKGERVVKYPLLKYIDWRYYKRAIFRMLHIVRTK